MESHQDGPFVLPPGRDLPREFVAAGFLQDEIPCAELPKRIVKTGPVKILGSRKLLRQTAADADVGELAVALHRNDKILFPDVVGDLSRLLQICLAQEDLAGVDLADGGLGIDVELADGLDLFVEKLDPHRMQRLPGKNIDDPAPQGELPALEDLGFGLVAGRLELRRKRRQIELVTATDFFRLTRERARRRCSLGEGLHRQDDDSVAFFAGDLVDFLQHREPLRR